MAAIRFPFSAGLRRGLLALGLLGLACAAQAETSLRIGYQKSSTLLVLLKEQGTLQRDLAAQGITLSWHEFSSGLPLLEALNVGNVDLSADVADTVPVFAQAAGAKLTYFARETPSPHAQAILVPEGSPLQSLADLKSKRIAVTKAAGSHYLLIAALQKAGLGFSDIQPAYLTPADGRAAVQPVSRAALDEQQRIADAFHAATLLPAPVDAGAVDLWCPTVPRPKAS